MNKENVRKIIQTYCENFDFLNDAIHKEYYKWEAFKHFEDNWDIEAENFAEMFKESMRLTDNLINNSRVSPTNGIVKLAEREELSEIIREMFRELFADDGGDIKKRQFKIETFRDKVNALFDQYEPGKWKYNQEFRTVLFYLTMRFPNENYLYKATQAREFMYCSEFGEDFGSGKTFNLPAYYRMCNELVEEIKNSPELIALHKERLTDNMINNDDYHLLAFDIIYCTLTYGLYSGIAIKKRVKNQSAKEKQEKIKNELQNSLESILEELNAALNEKANLTDTSVLGLKVIHKKFGEGTVTAQDGNIISVKYKIGEKSFSLPSAFTAGFLVCREQEVIELFHQQDRLDKKIKELRSKITSIKVQL